MSLAHQRQFKGIIPAQSAGARLDQVLAKLLPEYSRALIQGWIKQGHVRLDGSTCRPRHQVRGGEEVLVNVQPEAQHAFEPQPIPLDLVFEDEQILVVNKPPGIVMHPAAGNWQGTLLNALLHHAPELQAVPRAGIVHRLDKDTSGLLVVARTLQAHKKLVDQLQSRAVRREYLALVQGHLVAGGSIAFAIGRHPVHRTRMAVVDSGKPAVTRYRIERRFHAHTLLRVNLETGRTHQIRVHLAHIRHPLLGDPLYGGRLKLPPRAPDTLIAALHGFRRQALHSAYLSIKHPQDGDSMSWTAPMPDDMQDLIDVLDTVPEEYNKWENSSLPPG